MTFGTFKVEVKRGPAPDSSKGQLGVAGAAAAARRLAQAKEEEKLQNSLRQAEEAVARAGKDTAAYKQAMSVVQKLNAQLRAHRLVAQSQLQHEDLLGKKGAVDATEFHAIIPINDYPQKARWRVTNKETMVQVCPAFKDGSYRTLTEGLPSLWISLVLLLPTKVRYRWLQGARKLLTVRLQVSITSPARSHLRRGRRSCTCWSRRTKSGG